jgi:iron complex outermembrane receptor protein
LTGATPRCATRPGFGGSYRFFTANANDAHVTGLEASAAYALTPQLGVVAASLARMDSQLDRFTSCNGNTGGGRELANTPRYGYTARHRGIATASGILWQRRAGRPGRAVRLQQPERSPPRLPRGQRQPRLRVAQWTFTVWARNLPDNTYDQRVFFFGNEDPDYTETRYESRAAPRRSA